MFGRISWIYNQYNYYNLKQEINITDVESKPSKKKEIKKEKKNNKIIYKFLILMNFIFLVIIFIF